MSALKEPVLAVLRQETHQQLGKNILYLLTLFSCFCQNNQKCCNIFQKLFVKCLQFFFRCVIVGGNSTEGEFF